MTTGLKQESGQFFTPVPIAKYIIKCLPVYEITQEKLKKGNQTDLLPVMIDYAAGSGHFLTESMEEVQNFIDRIDESSLNPKIAQKIKSWKEDHFVWAFDYVYGIEKDYRLVKTAKVSCYLHGDGLAKVIHADGLDSFQHSKNYKGKLQISDSSFPRDNKQFDIVVSNPPYSVSAFKGTLNEEIAMQDFELFEKISDQSSEIECLFVERAKQLLKDDGVAGIVLPSTLLTNSGIYTKTREILLKYFDIIGITKLGSNTFMATGTNTVILFLKRRSNYVWRNVKNNIDLFLTNYNDMTVNKVEAAYTKYVDYVWEGLNLNDYTTLLKGDPNEKVLKHDLFITYQKKLRDTDDKFKQIIELEKEKLLYFILTFQQKVVITKTGEKEAEKHFLGYEFSNRRGHEGIHSIKNKVSIDESTKLFDLKSKENAQKASYYVYKNYLNENFIIDENLKENISIENLTHLISFDNFDFEKTISLSFKKKISITSSKWLSSPLSDLCYINGGDGFPKEYQNGGNVNDIPYYKVSDMNIKGNETYMSKSKNYVSQAIINENIKSKIFPVNTIIFPKVGKAIDTNKKRILGRDACVDNNVMGLVVKDSNITNPYFIFSFFCEYINLSDISSDANPPSISANTLQKLMIPFPDYQIQTLIADKIKNVNDQITLLDTKINELKENLKLIIDQSQLNAKSGYRLSDNDLFEISIGKRILKNELVSDGKIPVISANVMTEFGFMNKLLLTDFSIPSIIWGIDGDWLVNYIQPNSAFYPTDHCGVLRVLKPDLINSKYLSYLVKNEGDLLEFSRIKRASIDRIANIKVVLPTIQVQNDAVAKIEALENEITESKKDISQLSKVRKEILNKYLF